jgi:hypothetical protein
LRRLVELWIGSVVPPVVALVTLTTKYSLVHLACRLGRILPLHLVSAVALLLVAAAGIIAWRSYRCSAGDSSFTHSVLERSRFMAAVGVLISGLFVLVIIAFWIPDFFVGPCQG